VKRLLLALACALSTSPARADGPVRKSVWSFGLTGARHSLKAGNGRDEFLGNSAAVQIGNGSVAKSWYSLGSLDILLGPYEPALGDQLSVDYQGTGLTMWTGFSAQTLDLRSEAGGYGFALGLSYADIVGRSIGKNKKDDGSADPDNGARIGAYTMRVTNFSLLPGIFFSWLSPARPSGNAPELLATRTEGYILTLSAAMPLLVSYSAKFERLDGEQESDSGRLRGYSVLVTLMSLLGT
jgi:hypothetical protein